MIGEFAAARAMPKSRRALRAVAEAVLPSSLLVVRGPATRRRVALTFDDGPSELSLEYLELLERYGARATFFLVGAECERRPDLVREMARRGHELGSHGHSHERFPELSAKGALDAELAACSALLPGSAASHRWVRPPYGALSLGTLMSCARAGLTLVLWSLDSEDWRTQSPRDVVARVSPHTVEHGSIVLLHEGQRWTLDALGEIVPELERSGYELVTVGELLSG